jgi:uncharacterized repeat protein (TIGR02543 family)
MRSKLLFKNNKFFTAVIAAALFLATFTMSQVASAATTGVMGRYLSMGKAGDTSDWVEIAQYADKSLIVRKACLTNLGKVVFANSNTDYYMYSSVRDLVNNWFKNTLGKTARMRNFTIKSTATNSLADLGYFGTTANGISKPTDNDVSTGDDVAFLLSYGEAALYCSIKYATSTVSVTDSPALAKNNFNMLTRPGNGVMQDFWWLRSPGHISTTTKNASTIGTHGGILPDGTVYASSAQAAYPYVRPALWVRSSIFDDDVVKIDITYQPNGGVGTYIVDSVNSNTDYTIRQNPGYTKTDYIFDSWNTKSDGSGVKYDPDQVVTKISSSLVLFAQWKVIPSLSVTYYPNGGIGENVVDYFKAGTPYTILQNTFSRTGYIFNGWNTRENGTGSSYSPGNTISFTGSVDLYAQWKPVPQVTVTYYPNGGTGSNVIDFVNVGSAYTIKQNTFSKDGYTFEGWNTRADGMGTGYAPGNSITISVAVELYAQWKPVPQVTVTYYPNGGIGSNVIDYVNPGSTYTILPNTFSRDGYTFNGWNTRADGMGMGYSPGNSITITGAVDFYAQWKAVPQVTVTYYPNGGIGDPIVDYVNTGYSYTIRQNEFFKDGYKFNGWNTRADGLGISYMPGQIITATASISLYAKWITDQSSQTTIVYVPNGGEGEIKVVDVKLNAIYYISDQGYSLDGYTQNGWNTSPYGTGTSYSNGQPILVTGPLILYAQWIPGNAAPLLKITYHANGGSGEDIVVKVNANTYYTIVDQEEFTKAYYVRDGWNTRPDGYGNAYRVDQSIYVTTNLDLYVKWTPKI